MKRRGFGQGYGTNRSSNYAALSYVGVAAIALVTLYFMGAPSLEDILLAVLMLVF